MQVGIVDYGGGNTHSVRTALNYVGADVVLLDKPEQIASADRLVLPGVGATKPTIEALTERGLDQALDEAVRSGGRPLLAICVGMQLLAENLNEFGQHRGLGWVNGDVIDIRTVVKAMAPVPHMGWNDIDVSPNAEFLFEAVRGRRQFYFCHSYAVRPNRESDIAAVTEYGSEVVAALLKNTVLATQFHPEKSQLNGSRLLEAFLNWTP